jgi:hypothetical protein
MTLLAGALGNICAAAHAHGLNWPRQASSLKFSSIREAFLVSTIAEPSAAVRVRRHSDITECDVLVVYRGKEMSLRCRDYTQAVQWARIECKTYKIAAGFTVEHDRPGDTDEKAGRMNA